MKVEIKKEEAQKIVMKHLENMFLGCIIEAVESYGGDFNFTITEKEKPEQGQEKNKGDEISN